jgi:hypothetical protein
MRRAIRPSIRALPSLRLKVQNRMARIRKIIINFNTKTE